MRQSTRLCLGFAFSCLLVTAVAQAQAAYEYSLIDYPGAESTQVFGVNDHGIAVGNGYGINGTYPFVYDIKTGALTDVANVAGYDSTAFLGISDSGRLAGNVDDSVQGTRSGLVRDVQGADTVFTHPDAMSVTEARGINNQGLVSGSRDSAERPGEYAFAFVHDPKNGTFADFAESLITLAHGMNANGDVVGSAVFATGFEPTDPCPGLPGDPGVRRYGWLRTADGSLTYFIVNGESTRARGINDRGQIVGWVDDPSGGAFQKGFVVKLKGSGCQALTVPAGDLLELPGSVNTSPEGITNSGDVVGVAIDGTGVFHGFVATPK